MVIADYHSGASTWDAGFLNCLDLYGDGHLIPPVNLVLEPVSKPVLGAVLDPVTENAAGEIPV